jgi:cation diffusion facilitator family transporter
MDPGNRRAVLAALLANAGIAVAKFVGWMFTGAASLLAEAVHSVADTSNQALLLWGGAAAARAPTPSHPFGFGRERFFWSFVVALVLFSLGSLFAIYEGIAKVLHPHDLTDPAWAVGILVTGIVLEGFSFRTALKEARAIKGQASWWRFIRRTKNPELPVVLLEDLGALLGLLIAMAGVALAATTGDPRYDALGSIGIGVLLGVIAIVLAVEMKSLLIGESAAPRHEEAIRAASLGQPGVRRVIHLRTQHIGPDELLVGAKVEFDPTLDVRALADRIDALEARIRAALPFSAYVYIEPDVFRGGSREA